MPDSEKEKRKSHRMSLQYDLSNFLVVGENGKRFRCIATDVSREGLGIVAFSELLGGTKIVLRMNEDKERIGLKVRWCKQDCTRKNIFHIGLKTDDSNNNLITIFQKEGIIGSCIADSIMEDCDDDDEREVLNQAESGETPTEDDDGNFDLEFPEIQKLIGKLHSDDKTVLQRAGLVKLSETYKAYPINHNGVSLIVLIPLAFKPSAILEQDESTAAKAISIIKKEVNARGKLVWGKVWPLS